MATITREKMAKKKITPPAGLERLEKAPNKSQWIRAAIIAGTFAAIALLSVVTQGPGETRPDWQIILTRIALLSVTTVIYFYMLFSTRLNRKDDTQQEKPKKK